jgi:hypothetical protein
MAASRKQPLEFRKEEVSYVMQRWKAAESCSMVGVGSVGKSNLLQHLADPDVQTHYMNLTQTDQFMAIIIDPNLLGPLPQSGADADQIRCWAGYELMMHRLFMAFYPFDFLGKDDARRFYETYAALQDGTNPLYAYMGLRYFELGLDFFMRRGVRIVFMFDEFEEMLRQMPIKFFHTLRGIRDSNKRLLSYLAFTRAPLPVLTERLEIPALDIEPFIELFTDNVCYVGPYNDTDAGKMVESLSRRNQKAYSLRTTNFLLWSTGRYAGLLRAGYRIMDTIGNIDDIGGSDEMALEILASKSSIRQECQTIWSSLTPSEQYVLKAVARLAEYSVNEETEQAVAMLMQKRLVRIDKSHQTLIIEPPVLRAFVTSNPDVDL